VRSDDDTGRGVAGGVESAGWGGSCPARPRSMANGAFAPSAGVMIIVDEMASAIGLLGGAASIRESLVRILSLKLRR